MTLPKPTLVSSPQVFDRALVRQRAVRSAPRFAEHDFLFQEVDALVVERIGDIRRSFPRILNLGAHRGGLADYLAQGAAQQQDGLVVSTHLAQDMLPATNMGAVADEECIPFAAESFDLVTSSLALHWVNDLPGSLVQIKNILRTGGAFLAALIGGNTLYELRSCLTEAEMMVTGGASPRISPTIDLLTMSGLMQRAGFEVPVVDQETITLLYLDMTSLMRDVRGMGQGNANMQRLKTGTSRKVFAVAEQLYRDRFANSEGHLVATVDILFLHGWKA